jgi:hypothetical protein
VATECLTGIAGLATQFGRHAVAARLFGAVETLRETVGPPGSRYAEERQAQDMAAVRDALGTEVGAWVTGRALPLDAAVSESLALAAEIVGDAAGVGLLHGISETS